MPITCNTHTCSNNALHQCGACKTASYCSAACQRADWAEHKPICALLTGSPRSDIDLMPPQQQRPKEKEQIDTKAVLIALLTERTRSGAAVANAYRVDEARELDNALADFMTPLQREALHTRMIGVRDTLVKTFSDGMTRSEANFSSIEEGVHAAIQQFGIAREEVISAVGITEEANAAYWRERELDALADETFQYLLNETREEIAAGKIAPPPANVQQQIDGCLDSLWARFGTADADGAEDEDSRVRTTRLRRATIRRSAAIAERTGQDEGSTVRRLMDKMEVARPSLTSTEAFNVVKKLLTLTISLSLLGGAYLVVRETILPDGAMQAAKEHIAAARDQVTRALGLLNTAESAVKAAGAVQRDTMAEMLDRGKIISAALAQAPDAGDLTISTFKGMMTEIVESARKSLVAAEQAPRLDPQYYAEQYGGNLATLKTVSDASMNLVNDWAQQLRNAATMADVKQVAEQYNVHVEALAGVSMTKLVESETIYQNHMGVALSALAGTKEELKSVADAVATAATDLSSAISKAERVRSSTPVMTSIARSMSQYLGTGEGGSVFLAQTLLRQATALEATFGTFVVDIATRGISGLPSAFAVLGGNLIVGYMNGELSGLLNMLLGGTAEYLTKSSERWLLNKRNAMDATSDGSGAMRPVFDLLYQVVSSFSSAASAFRKAQAFSGLATGVLQIGYVFATMLFGFAVSLMQIGVVATTTAALVAVGVAAFALYCRVQSPLFASLLAPAMHHIINYGQWYVRAMVIVLAIWSARARFGLEEWKLSSERWLGFLRLTGNAPNWGQVVDAVKDPQLTTLITAKNTLATHLSLVNTDLVNTEQLLGVSRIFVAGVELKTT